MRKLGAVNNANYCDNYMERKAAASVGRGIVAFRPSKPRRTRLRTCLLRLLLRRKPRVLPLQPTQLLRAF